MGTILSYQLHFSSLFQRKSKSRRRVEILELNNNANNISINDQNISSTNFHFIEELVPERYLVLLTEQMTEMLCRLMNLNETSISISDNKFNRRKTLRFSLGSDDLLIPIILPNSNSNIGQSSLQLQSTYPTCVKCKMKMLTIEEFCQLNNAFHRVDSDHDNFLTRDEIRTILNYLFELTEYDINEIISIFDRNEDDRISLEEYIEEMKHRLLHEFTREEIKIAFNQADIQKNGHLHADELKNAINYLNLHVSNRRIVEIVNDCIENDPTDSIDFVFFTNIVEELRRREPITLEKFKLIQHRTHTTTMS